MGRKERARGRSETGERKKRRKGIGRRRVKGKHKKGHTRVKERQVKKMRKMVMKGRKAG